MRERIAGPNGTNKPLQIAVDSVTGTTERQCTLTLPTALRSELIPDPTGDDPYEEEPIGLGA
jgi:hypothetical protein